MIRDDEMGHPEALEQDASEAQLAGHEQRMVCEEQLKTLQERYAYLAADFDNYRKRQEVERMRQVIAVQSVVLRDILPIIDDIERAIVDARSRQASATEDVAMAVLLEGMALIEKNVQKLRDKYQLQEIPTDGPFNPELHEAILHVDVHGRDSGSIVDVLEKGYTIRGVLLRPARVSVAR